MIPPRAARVGRCVRPLTLTRHCTTILLGLVAAPLAAQDAGAPPALNDVDAIIQQQTFATPPAAIADAVLAPRHLNVTLSSPSPDKRWFLDEIGDGPVTMDVFSRPYHELGGLFVDYRANRVRSLTVRNNVGIQVVSAADGATRNIEVPRGARVSGATWSPDGRRIAYLAHFDDATHIYLADPATGESRQLTRTPLLATLVTEIAWTRDGKSIVTVLVPEDRPAMPVRPDVPPGPQVKVAEESDKNRLRTYASLLATPYDEALLEWHTTGQLALIDVENRRVRTIGAPAMIRAIDPSPDGRFVRVTRMVKPFSYIVPVNNFGSVDEVWDVDGNVLARIDTDELNVGVQRDNLPTAPGAGGGAGDNDDGPRLIAWRADGQGLTFLQQEPAPQDEDSVGTAEEEDQENGRRRRKDRLMQWLPPFDSANLSVLYENDRRLSTYRFSPDMQILFLTERTGERTHEFAIYLNEPARKYTLARYDSEDVYANPGSIVLATGGFGGGGRFGGGRFGGGTGGEIVQLSSDGQHVFYQGTQYDRNPLEVGPKGFIDKVAIRTGEKQRVFEGSNQGVYERPIAILDADATRIVITRESPTEVPQAFLRENGQLTQLTDNQDYTPDLTRAPRLGFTVERPDGFRFRVNVTLPPGSREGERLPAMFWFYPREYTDQESYDRTGRTYNRNEFPNFNARSIQFLVRLGYAVVEPDAPIVGQQGQMNNNYEHDLRNNLAAVIDELDRRGIIDRQRIGIGGHSYGAFSTVNAMVHTPFFKAGIAGDGNYNRTLTPLNFQSERRDLWEAREVYLGMSPLLYANNLTGALLLYHGLADQNVGTDPINSPRLFHALNGLGKTVSMYLYPFEDHGPATKETLLDLWARWTAWLDKYVKNPRSGEQQKVTTQDESVSMR